MRTDRCASGAPPNTKDCQNFLHKTRTSTCKHRVDQLKKNDTTRLILEKISNGSCYIKVVAFPVLK